MSHQHEPIICPNCNSVVTGNYCSQCGQETHLHDDTFWALLVHFFGHFINYDSKAWKTLKTLLFKPGELTIAYRNKQRMRYIAPVSLYFFISAIFFLITSLNPTGEASKTDSATGDAKTAAVHTDTVINVNPHQTKPRRTINFQLPAIFRSGIEKTRDNMDAIDSEGERGEQMLERFFHLLPRVFFFMIPFMAFILQLLFLRRKDQSFVQHAIFTFHFQSFWFILMGVALNYPFYFLNAEIVLAAMALIGVYFLLALKKVYGIGWGRSILYTFITSISFGVVLLSGIVILLAVL